MLTCIIDERGLVKDNWIKELPKFVKENKALQQLTTEEKMPTHEPEIARWCYVGRNRESVEKSQRYALMYLVDPGFPLRDIVQLRFQGFVEQVNLKPLGTWDE